MCTWTVINVNNEASAQCNQAFVHPWATPGLPQHPPSGLSLLRTFLPGRLQHVGGEMALPQHVLCLSPACWEGGRSQEACPARAAAHCTMCAQPARHHCGQAGLLSSLPSSPCMCKRKRAQKAFLPLGLVQKSWNVVIRKH